MAKRKAISVIDIKEMKKIALDTETDSNLEMELFSIAGRDRRGRLISGVLGQEYFNQFWDIMKDKKIIFHHAKFDMRVLKRKKVKYEKIDFEDTMIMAHLLDENRRKALKELRKTVLGLPERDTYKDIIEKHEKIDTKEGREYARLDAEDTYKLYEKFDGELAKEDLETVYKLEKAVIFPVIMMEEQGCFIDSSLLDYQRDLLMKYKTKIEKYVNKKMKKDILLTSPKQLQEMFFKDLGYPPNPNWKNKTGYSTAEPVLEWIAGDKRKSYKQAEVIAEAILDHRKYSKLLSAFINSITTKLSDDGRIHASFNSTGTTTGRFSSNDPNLQQVPKEAFEYLLDEAGNFVLNEEGEKIPDLKTHIRSLFIAPQGKKIVTADYSQIELRMMALLSQDPNMLEAFRRNMDIHTKTAQLLGISRASAKMINFGIGYGMGPGTFARTLNVGFKTACEYIDGFWNSYPVLAKFFEKVRHGAEQLGYVRTISGRKRRFLYYDNSTGRQAGNTTIQGSSADLMKIALIDIYKNMNSKKAKLIMTVHDEISAEVDEDYSDEFSEILKESMEKAIPSNIPLVAEPVCAKRWSESK